MLPDGTIALKRNEFARQKSKLNPLKMFKSQKIKKKTKTKTISPLQKIYESNFDPIAFPFFRNDHTSTIYKIIINKEINVFKHYLPEGK